MQNGKAFGPVCLQKYKQNRKGANSLWDSLSWTIQITMITGPHQQFSAAVRIVFPPKISTFLPQAINIYQYLLGPFTCLNNQFFLLEVKIIALFYHCLTFLILRLYCLLHTVQSENRKNIAAVILLYPCAILRSAKKLQNSSGATFIRMYLQNVSHSCQVTENTENKSSDHGCQQC